ncbi:MAG: glutamyl-tRNA reductase [Haloarculaceae archaeon]
MTGRGAISGASVAHDRADIDEIENAAVESHRTGVAKLVDVPCVTEAFVLQTCNRVEAYVVTEDAADGRAALDAFFSSVPDDALTRMDHEESLRHLMRVAAGLESLVVGEDQIIGQVGEAFEAAHDADGIGPVLEQGVTKAIRVGERARTETPINEGSVSVASAAVSLADEEGALGEAALVVGAGDMGQLAAKSLADHVETLYVANRSRDRAETLASLVDAETEIVGLDDVAGTLGAASVVVTATGSGGHVFDADAFADAGETFVVDIARPRDVPPAVAGYDDVTVRDIDALESVTDENRRERATAAAQVEEMIDVEFEHLLEQYKRRRADDVISAMYESAERVKVRELDTALERGDFDEEQREVLEAMADAIVNQLLSAPTESLRDAAAEDDWSTINTALQLFDPDFGPEDVPVSALASGTLSPEDVPESVRDRVPSGVFDNPDD